MGNISENLSGGIPDQKSTNNTAKQHIQSIIYEMQDIVEKHPYHAFALLAILIEVLGKCLSNDEWQSGYSRITFNNAIKSFSSLQKYSKIKDLYSVLRCGMSHALLPKNGILLRDGTNDLTNNTIGCKDLYADIKSAWEDIKIARISSAKDLSAFVTQVNDSMTGATPYTSIKH